MRLRFRQSPGQRDGFTLIEVMTALMIAAITALAFFQVFAFGTVQVERLGLRRQALGLLDGEMEYWRARFRSADAASPVHPGEAEARRRPVVMDEASGLTFQVDPEISPPRGDRGLKYQNVLVQVSYQRAEMADTVVLESRMYAR